MLNLHHHLAQLYLPITPYYLTYPLTPLSRIKIRDSLSIRKILIKTNTWCGLILQILNYTEKKLQDCFPHDDYKEFLQLIVIFLGEMLKGNVIFRQSGAYHLTRWMAKRIYSLIIVLCKNQFKQKSTEEMSFKKKLVVSLINVMLMFTAPNSIRAPVNDI